MSANIANVINILLNQGGALAQADNVNVVGMITSDGSGPISINDRTRSYTDLASVATDFGTVGAVYEGASTFFGTSPNSVNAGGRLVIGYWEKNGDPGEPATSGNLSGGIVSDVPGLITSLQAISDGYFTISIDGVSTQITGLNFTGIVNMSDADNILYNAVNAAVLGASTFWTGDVLVVISPTSGSSSSVSTSVDELLSGTYIGTLLQLESGQGAVSTQGQDSTPGTSETAVEALTAIQAEVAIKGAAFIDAQDTDQEVRDLAAYAQANNILIYDVFSNTSNLDTVVGNPAWDIKLASQRKYRMLYSKANNRKFAISYMARMHSVNFNASDSAITMHLKELNITPETYTQTEIDKAKNIGLDIYTTIKDVPVVLSSGANDFTDNQYNLMAYIGDLEVDMFNVLKGTNTKIKQTTRDVNKLIDQAEKTTEKYRRAGVFAPGTWTSTDTFGDLEVFERSIENNGYYWLAGRLANQSQADRDARKSPVLQGAVKAAGAVHSADIIVNFNR